MSHPARPHDHFGMRILRGLMALSKFLAFLGMVLGIMLVGAILKMLPVALAIRRHWLAHWNSLLCRFCLWAMRVRVDVHHNWSHSEASPSHRKTSADARDYLSAAQDLKPDSQFLSKNIDVKNSHPENALSTTSSITPQLITKSKTENSSSQKSENPHSKLSKRPSFPSLIVANHMGMLDILSINAFLPCLFVTSYELKETPVVGWLTEAGGCLFVERRSRQNIFNEVKNIAEALSQGVSVCIFPEAQSTNGEQVLPFKKSLLVAAAESQVPILPITINYLTIDDRLVTTENRDYICWYGDQSFLGALWRLLTNWSMHIELILHTPCVMRSVEERREVTEECYRKVSEAFRAIG